jgi:hypothetical protein
VQRLQVVEVAFLEQPVLAVEALAAQPDDLGWAEAQRAHEIELLAKLADVDLLGELHRFRPVGEGEAHVHVRIPKVDELVHQELVEIRVEQRAHDRIDMVAVVEGALGEVHQSMCLRPTRR